MIVAPADFDSKKFMTFYNLPGDPQAGAFWIDAQGFFQCPALPNLTQEELSQFTLEDKPATLEQRTEALELLIDILLEPTP